MNREVAHQIGYLPLLWVALVVLVSARLLKTKKVDPAVILIALAFFVSYPWDSVVYALPTEDQFQPSYFFLPVQIWFVLLAFVKGPMDRLFCAGALVLLALASAAFSWPGPDFLLTLVGSAAILSVARGWLAAPLWVYFFLGTWAYFSFAFGANFTTALDAYQACRALAFMAFIGIMAPPLIRRWRVGQWWNTSRRS